MRRELQLQSKKLLATTLIAAALMSTTLIAQEIDVKISNNTNGIYFTPLLVSAHPSTTALFISGEAASTHLEAMAEGGDVSGLVGDLDAVNADSTTNPAEGLLVPGASTMTTLVTVDENTNLSIVAMMLPTNDGFVALNNWKIPTEAGTYKININAYDAGSEANSELAADIPQPPVYTLDAAATGFTTATEEGFVHIHRGNIGDSNDAGGKSALNALTQRWLNPVATITVTVK